MNSYLPQVTNHGVCFFILIFLKEAKDQIKEKEQLNEFIDVHLYYAVWVAESSLVCLCESVVYWGYQHHVIENVFPVAVFFDDDSFEEVLVFFTGVVVQGFALVVVIGVINKALYHFISALIL